MITETHSKPLYAGAYQASFRITDVQTFIGPGKRYLVSKRLMDILGSLTLIFLIMVWIIPVVALLIKIDSSGPVFFVQRRVGKRGRSFSCIKFRSMVQNRDADKKQALPGDLRITRVGRFLRKSNIDELPQLFNVLWGDMSLTGPRPHMPSDCRRFSSLIPEYEFRNLVKPGITGLAQVNGFHGPTLSEQEILERFHWDMTYIRNFSLILDLKIIFQTAAQKIRWIPILFRKNFPD